MMLEKMRYNDLDGLKLGSGVRANFAWNHTFDEIPQIGTRLMYRLGRFHTSHKSKLLSAYLGNAYKDERIMPTNYHDIGIGFSYGDSYQGYGQAWHPYLDASLFYSQKEKKLYSDIVAGVAGSLSKQDTLAYTLLYQDNMNGQSYKNYSLNLNYSHLYKP